jgi:protein-tyrosine phosphatase
VNLFNVPGKLYLSHMPGRYETLSVANTQILRAGIDNVIALTHLEEIRRKSPEYAESIVEDSLPWRREEFAIEDYTTPTNWEAFLNLAKRTASDLQAGKNVMIHCGAGVGRTGTLAIGVLLALGISLETALDRVKDAGSRPETQGQEDLVKWMEGSLQ